MSHRHLTPQGTAAFFASTVASALALLLLSTTQDAQAQAQTTSEPEQALAARRVPVGDATQGLLALQREGSAASATPRPIAGDVAQLSYQRYLDSFDGAKHPIPAQFGTTVKASGSAGSR
ncbi:DUF3613 domain-containing protein [Variovorax guangxiensis]|uniref:DUF3613 domain-containing protein n=1 Tax=Variovorax guangxiensis TaxID=1775474 RepID=A0A502E281_9BURK|nr:DUF3613 domain-containing protein [Variovorax guangxiensis]RZI68778.1 MAG: DUF3613 domain-containing protein [Variovorax sp.]TPG26884.1 DUF3613 domain-containing protein [Variovorax ginsengisoli]TPG30611.1 DUF3613 domain-containing protein [Variovorax guangxiensis]